MIGHVTQLRREARTPDPREAEALVAVLQGTPGAPGRNGSVAFQWVNLAAVGASAFLWWAARKGTTRPSALLTMGLMYEVVICAVISTVAIWQHFLEFGMNPNLTWVPAVVILFPLILPGPPRRVLAGAVAAGATVPLALLGELVEGRRAVERSAP